MSQLSPKARALLARTSSKYDPSAADRDRLRSALHARIGLGIAASVAVAATTLASPVAARAAGVLPATALPSATAGGAAVSVAAKASVAMIVAKTLAMIFVVGSVGATAVVLAQKHVGSKSGAIPPSAASPQVKAAAPSTPPAAAPPVDEAQPIVTVASLPPARSTARHAPPAPAPVAGPDPLDAEMALLRDAQAALRRHEGARALEALDTHARRFPNGLLAEERAAARVFALCELGRVDEGTREKSAFLAAHPVSPQAERVRRACAPVPGE